MAPGGGSARATAAFVGGAVGEAVSFGGWVDPGRARAAVAAGGGFVVPARMGGGAPPGPLLLRSNWGE